MCTHFRSLLSLVGLALLVSILSTAQSTGVAATEPSSAAANPDYSRDGVIVEHYTTRVVYDADGTGTREIAAMVRMQAVSRLSWKWRERSSVKIAERTYEKRTQALHC